MKKTIRDVAAVAGVSPATVSRVLNKSGYVSKKAYDSVMKAIEKMDYSPNAMAVSLSKSRSRLIGIIVPSIYNEFFIDVVYAVEKKAESCGFRVLFCNTDYSVEKERAAIEDLISYKAVGLIIIPNRVRENNNVKLLNQLLKNETPVVCVDRELPGFAGDTIYIDNDSGLTELVEAIDQKGHKRIAVLLDTKEDSPGSHISKTDTDRIETVRKALHAHHLELCEEYILRTSCADNSYHAAMKRFAEMPKRPTAVITLSSKATVCAVCGFVSHGIKIPEDIFVAGYDDFHVLDAFRYSVQYSPVPVELGAVAAQTLFNRLEPEGNAFPSQHITIPSRMSIEE